YRRDALQKYADFVSGSKDFPLTEFRERESPATEAVGYGKSMMLFHMLRRAYGDEVFLASLRRFYDKNRFRKASWSDLGAAFPGSPPPGSRFSAKEMIEEWTTRTGAPRLCLKRVEVVPDTKADSEGGVDPGWSLEATVAQTQGEAVWKLDVPLQVSVAGLSNSDMPGDPFRARGMSTYPARFDRGSRTAQLKITLSDEPRRVAIDPDFDLFRRIEREEIPAALSLAFGADTALAVLPSDESEEMQKAYRAVAEGWARGKESSFKIALDSEVTSL